MCAVCLEAQEHDVYRARAGGDEYLAVRQQPERRYALQCAHRFHDDAVRAEHRVRRAVRGELHEDDDVERRVEPSHQDVAIRADDDAEHAVQLTEDDDAGRSEARVERPVGEIAEQKDLARRVVAERLNQDRAVGIARQRHRIETRPVDVCHDHPAGAEAAVERPVR